MASDFTVSGAVSSPLSGLNASVLSADYAAVTVTIDNGGSIESYTGTPLYDLISAAGFQSPSGKNGQLRDFVVVSGGGQAVVVSEGEIDPSFGGAVTARTDIVAYEENGAAVSPTLIIPGDVNGGMGSGGVAGRDVSGITGISVGIAALPSIAVVSGVSTSVTVTGDVASAGATYTVANLQSLPVTSQTDTFLQGTSPKTYSFTGASLFGVVSATGLTDPSILGDYVVAEGSDGYAVTYSLGEIDPAYRANPVAIVAYDDGTGTFPSIGAGDGALRTTAPTDSKGGRYVSNLEALAVDDAVACFVAGTRIETTSGEALVESLRLGDLVVTEAGEALPVIWIGERRIDLRRHSAPAELRPVRIMAGAFGNAVPGRDLLLSPDHAVFADGVLIPVKYLINGLSIRQEAQDSVHYFHVELDRHAVIRAEGLAVESYLETGQRSAFRNGGPAIALHPDFARRAREAGGCAPLRVTGPAVMRLREQLLAVAAGLATTGQRVGG